MKEKIIVIFNKCNDKKIFTTWWFPPIFVHYFLLILATVIPYFAKVPKSSTVFAHLSKFWFQLDSLWYIKIAQDGYKGLGDTAFFPFVPLLIKISHSPYVALLITQIGFVFCLYFLREFFKRLKINENQIKLGIWFFVLNPCAIFYSIIYTELWTVLFSLISLHMFIKRRYCLAYLFAALLTSVRPTAIIFGIFPLVLFISSLHKRDWQTSLKSFLWGLSCTVGLLCFMTYLWVHFRDPFIFNKSQSLYWGHYWMNPITQLIQGFNDPQKFILAPRQGLWTYTIFFIFIAIYGSTKLKSNIQWETWGAIFFVFIGLIFNLSFGTKVMPLFSTFRYLSVLFPVYAIMAITLPKPIRILLLILSIKISFLGAWGFINGNWFL